MYNLSLETKKYEVKICNFEGPLELLCHLIDKNKMDIYDIKISEITEQYIEYINQMEKENLEVTSDFLIMASTLLYIKSKGLLPKIEEDEEDISEEDLMRKLVEYKQYKEISQKLRQAYNTYSNRVYKLPDSIALPKQKLETTYESAILVDAYKELHARNEVKINLNSKENMERIALGEYVTILSKVRIIFKELFKKPSFLFNKVFNTKTARKVDVVTAFLSVLELSRKNRITTSQEQNFSDIEVKKKLKRV